MAQGYTHRAAAQKRDLAAELAALQERIRLIGEVDQLTFAARHREALPLAMRVLELTRRTSGRSHADTAWALERVARVQEMLGRHADSEPPLQEAIQIHLHNRAINQVQTATQALVVALEARGRRVQASAYYAQGAAPRVDPVAVASRLNYLSVIREEQARFSDAEQLAKRALELRQEYLGHEHTDVGISLNNLAMIHLRQGRRGDVEPLLMRALTIAERHSGPASRDVATIVGNLASVIEDASRAGEVEALHKRVIAISERNQGSDHRNTLIARNNLASFYRVSDRLAEAEATQQSVLADLDASLARYRNNDLARSFLELPRIKARALATMAAIHNAQGRIDAARGALEEALRLEEENGSDHIGVESAAGRLGSLDLAAGRTVEAHRYLQRAASLAVKRLALTQGAASSDAATHVDRLFETAALAAVRRADEVQGSQGPGLLDEAFGYMQWASRSAASAAVAQLGARFAAGDGDLAALIRQRQDLASDIAIADHRLTEALARGPDSTLVPTLRSRISDLEASIGKRDREIGQKFPAYVTLTSPAPLSVAEVQGLLGSDEALLQVVSAETASVALLVTRDRVHGSVLREGAAALAKTVKALRCGLDRELWLHQGLAGCAQLLSTAHAALPANGEPLPFDYGLAHALYNQLLGGRSEMVRGKHLLVVVSGALAQLPFQVLVSEPVDQGQPIDPRKVAWLARDHAISVLPAVASLKALRAVTKTSMATLQLIGFGNPLLDGRDDDGDRRRAARLNQTCPVQIATLPGVSKGVTQIEVRGGQADIAQIRAQLPLPETAEELCAVAENLGVRPADIYLGARATVSEVVRLSTAGRLADYRYVHFATHGAMAGEIIGSSEPGLLLTPPAAVTDVDDGYLSASKIAGLNLDADWVLLSACNTAAGGANDADALAGLARAFFYAGARSLLVSHWAVNSNATVKIITGAFSRLRQNASIGRAEALRQAMLSLINHGAAWEAQPAVWAPFVVVGADGSGT